MGRGRRQATVARNAPAGHIVPLSDCGRGQRVPEALSQALTTDVDPQAEIQTPAGPTSGEHTLELKITGADCAPHLGVNGGPDEAFADACVDKALSQHSHDAEVIDIDGEDPGKSLEVTVSDNDGDLTVTYLCEKI